MNILVVNDDSIHAPGIAALARAASEIGDVWIVAPAEQCSAMSQKLTLRETLSFRKLEDFPANVKGAYEVGGTPVDCVKVALYYVLKEKPDLVLSGINNGYNAGYDINYSGTLGAAFEALHNGIPAVAFSAAGDAHLEAAQPYVLPLLRQLLEKETDMGAVWNVNFPAMKDKAPEGILWDVVSAPVSMFEEIYIETPQPDGTMHLACRGVPIPNSKVPAGTDVEAVRKGYISVGKVRTAGM